VSKVGPAKAVEPGPVTAASTGSNAGSSAVEVHISTQARDLAASAGAPVNHAKVEDIKSKLAQGTLKIDSQVVAQRLLSALG
jgi:flagellar biosynthesis anti-sigma factor FlgM